MDVRLCGRADELARLERLAADAVRGAGAVVLLTGEAGVGKSALAEAVAARSGVPVLSGRAVPDAGAPAYWPWLRLLADAARAALPGLSPALLDLAAGGARQPAAAARFVAGQATVDALLAAAGAAGGLVLVLEDLHWADEPSRALLRSLAADLAGAPLLVLATSREPAGDAELAALPRAHPFPVGPLTEPAVAEYLHAVAGGPVHPTWPPAAHRLTGGNPLYLRELARLLARRDALAGPAAEVDVPVELRRLVAQHTAALSPACNTLLGGAAALGAEVDVPLLTAAARASAADEPTGDGPAAALSEALAAGVLVEDPLHPATLRFSHDLVRQACYAALDRRTRIDWHRRIADALADGASPAELAGHRLRAADDAHGRGLAAAACAAAGDAAAAGLDVAGAVRWYGEALAVTPPGDRGRRAELLLARAEAAYRDGRLDEAVTDCAEAMDLAEVLRRPGLAAEAALVVRGVGGALTPHLAQLCARARAMLGEEDSARHARVLAQEAYLHASRGDPAAAAPVSRRATAMAVRAEDPTALVAALHAAHEVLDPADAAQTLALADRMCALAAASGRPDAELWGRIWRLDGYLLVGDLAAFGTETGDLGGLADRLGWPMVHWHLLRARATGASLAGRFPEAERLALQARDLARRAQISSGDHLYLAFLGGLAMHTGRWELPPDVAGPSPAEAAGFPVAAAQFGLRALHRGDAGTAALFWRTLRPKLDRLPRDSRWWFIVIAAGELAAAAGDLAGARACLRLAGAHRDRFLNSTTNCHGAAARPLGRIALALGDHDGAVRDLAVAVDLEAGIGALPFAAHAQLELARALAARGAAGDRDRARGCAAEAARTARRLGMPPVLAAATGLHDELSGVRGGVAALTVREREIAGLLAAGLANRAIAGRLVVSERTVETHVRNLLAKLGLANRTQVAAWAAGAGLRTGSAQQH